MKVPVVSIDIAVLTGFSMVQPSKWIQMQNATLFQEKWRQTNEVKEAPLLAVILVLDFGSAVRYGFSPWEC